MKEEDIKKREEASKELERRGYTKDGAGIVRAPNGKRYSWFQAISIEGIKIK